MTANDFKTYLENNNCTVGKSQGSYVATRNDDPSKTVTYETSGPKVTDNVVQYACNTLGIAVP